MKWNKTTPEQKKALDNEMSMYVGFTNQTRVNSDVYTMAEALQRLKIIIHVFWI